MMLLNKFWLETKNRFFIGLLSISALCLFFVLAQPWILEHWRLDEINDPKIYNPPWLLIARVDYNYFIWHFLYNHLLQFTWAILTLMLALGGLSSEQEHGSVLFTLSLPVTRKRFFFQRAAVGYIEASGLALLPAVIIPLVSPVIGSSYPLSDALKHAILFIAGGTVYYTTGLLINITIKSEAVAFFVGIGFIIVFYFIFQTYADEDEKPIILRLIDLPGFIGGNPSPIFSISLWWIGCTGSLGISLLTLMISYRITLKKDF